MNINFEYSAAWLILIVLLALGGAFLLYYFKEGRRNWPATLRYVLGGLRFVLLFGLGFLLLQPFIVKQVDDVEKPLLLLFEDQSASIDDQDEAAVSTYFGGLEETLSEGFDVRRIPFAERTSADDAEALNGLNTDIGSTFEHINNAFQGSNIGAIVLASDGILNQGRDPRYVNLNTSAPLFGLLMGDTNLRTDIGVERVRANNLAFLGNDIEIRASINALKLDGEKKTARLLRNGEQVATQKISIKGDRYSEELSFLVRADEVGVARYTVQVDSLDIESNKENNRSETYVEVLDNRTRIVILAHAPHPDIAAIKESIEVSEQYEVAVTLLEDWSGNVGDGDLFITHGLPSDEQDLTRIQPIVNAAKPVFAVVTADVSLAHFNALNLGLNIRTTRNQRDEAGGQINPDFSLFNLSASDQLERYPPLMVPFGEMQFTANAQVALKQRIGGIQTDQPFWVFTEKSGQKHSILLAEGWWRWRLFNRVQNPEIRWTDELLQKTVQYLAIRQKRTRLAVEVPERFIEGEPVVFSAEYYNEAFELNAEVPIDLELVHGDSAQFSYRFNPQGNAYTLNLGTLAPGDYAWTARVATDDIAYEQKGSFKVLENRTEFQTAVAQHGLIRYLAAQRDGSAFALSEQEQLTQRLRNLPTAKPVIHSSTEWISLIEWQTLLFLLAVLAGLEWFLRKINGYV